MSVWQDIRFGARTLLKAPGFAATAVITMAVGIGVTTSIFSVCDAMMWRPVPLPHLETLATIVERVPGDANDWNQTTPADTDDIRAQSSAFSSMAEWQTGLANIAASRVEPDRALQALVSANFFSVAGVQPSRGRGVPARRGSARSRERSDPERLLLAAAIRGRPGNHRRRDSPG